MKKLPASSFRLPAGGARVRTRSPDRTRATKVRILAGRWKGKALEVPPGARPTPARAREALFSIFQDVVPGARVLDLYAGSGAVGLEALSRGAARVCLVEENSAALARTIERLGTDPTSVELIAGTAAGAIDRLRQRGARFDLAFADPPYASSPAEALTAGALLDPGGFLVLQRDAEGPETLVPPAGLRHVETRAYARTLYHLFAPEGAPERSRKGFGRSAL